MKTQYGRYFCDTSLHTDGVGDISRSVVPPDPRRKVCNSHSHTHGKRPVFPVLCKPRVAAATACPPEDETTRIHTTWQVEIFVTLRHHLLTASEKIYELVPFFSASAPKQHWRCNSVWLSVLKNRAFCLLACYMAWCLFIKTKAVKCKC